MKAIEALKNRVRRYRWRRQLNKDLAYSRQHPLTLEEAKEAIEAVGRRAEELRGQRVDISTRPLTANQARTRWVELARRREDLTRELQEAAQDVADAERREREENG